MNSQKILEQIIKKISVTSEKIGATFPHVSKDGVYDNCDIAWWTNGFWGGLLWLLYNETKDDKFKIIAENCEKKLDEAITDYYGLHHDVGFMWILTSIANYKITGNEESKKRALHVANILAGRFNIKGNFIRAWNGDHYGYAIIDCMMNIPLLYWATEQTLDPRYKHIAMAHADMVLEKFIRPDGSVNHIVNFDIHTGVVIDIKGGQGYSPTSAWARGTSWAIYGMALSYKYTNEKRYLDAAKNVAHFFVANLPENSVPAWDFRAPAENSISTDTSAGACAACGMLEIAKYVCEEEKELYIGNARKILTGLYEEYSNFGNERQELLRGGTGHKPADQNINVGLIYGDYFFAEAILKLENPSIELFW